MLNPILDNDEENTTEGSNESLYPLDEKEPEIQGEGDTDFDRDVRGETLPSWCHFASFLACRAVAFWRRRALFHVRDAPCAPPD